METSNSVAKGAVLNAKPQMRAGTIETCNSGTKVAVLNAKKFRRSLGPLDTCNSDPKVAVLHAKTTDEGWDP